VFSPGSEELHEVGNNKDTEAGDREEEGLVKAEVEGRA
jgi:hypothetical protein